MVSCSEQGKSKQLRYLRKRTRKVIWVELEKTHRDYLGKKPSVLGLGRGRLKEGLCVLGAAMSSFRGRRGPRREVTSEEALDIHREVRSMKRTEVLMWKSLKKNKQQEGQLRIESGHKREVGLGRERAQRAQAGKLGVSGRALLLEGGLELKNKKQT